MTAKVFVIGFHKTGTTSLGAALKLLGYRVDHRRWKDEITQLPAPLTRSDLAARAVHAAKDANAFEDNPWPLLYAEVDQAFPGSKFILTRRDPAKWYQSMVTHFGSKPSAMRGLIYGPDAPAPEGNQSRYLCQYQSHIDGVLQFFAERPDDLMITDIADANWDNLCAFLGKPKPATPFPHAGTAKRRAKGRWLKRLLGKE